MFVDLFEVVFLVKAGICNSVLHGHIFHICNMNEFQVCVESVFEIFLDSFVVGEFFRLVVVNCEVVAREIEELFRWTEDDFCVISCHVVEIDVVL